MKIVYNARVPKKSNGFVTRHFYGRWQLINKKGVDKYPFETWKVQSCRLKIHWEVIAYLFQKYPEHFSFQLLIIVKAIVFLKSRLLFNNLKTRIAMSAKNFAICAKAIIHLLLHNLHDCTFKSVKAETFHFQKIRPKYWISSSEARSKKQKCFGC